MRGFQAKRLAGVVAALTAATVFLLGTAACGDGGTGSASPTPTPDGSPSAEPTPGVTPVTTDEAVLDLAAQEPPLTIHAAGSGDFEGGFASLTSGDFNDDGLEDLLIGAPMSDGPDSSRPDAGEAYVLFGREDSPQSVDLAASEQDITIYGATTRDYVGASVLAADLNGDGIDDIVVGGPGVTAGADPRTDQGRAYVFFGSKELAPGTFDLVEDPQDFVVTGAEGFSRIGQAMASGDVNDDGIADLVLGAPFAGREVGSPPGSPRLEAGEVYAVFGSPSLSGELNIAFTQPDFMVSSRQRSAHFGENVAVGDVDGDGVDDIVAGAPFLDGPEGERAGAGAVFVFFGGSDLGGRRFLEKGEHGAAIYGAQPGDRFGAPLAVADINGDEIADIIVAARLATVAPSGRIAGGAVHVLFGSSRIQGFTGPADETTDMVVLGEEGSSLATSLAAGDLNGDGLDDFIMGSTLGARQRRGAGAVYVVWGSATPADSVDIAEGEQDFTLLGAQDGDQLGGMVAIAMWAGDPVLLTLARGADSAYSISLPR